MKQRCENPHHAKYSKYGAIGISVCDRWKKFENFLADMGERPEGMSIDRIDGSKGYSPDNCRWATAQQQQENIRSNVFLTLSGETLTISSWAKRLGVNPSNIRYRLKSGWTEDEILRTPFKFGNRLKKTKCKTITAFGETMDLSGWSMRFGVKPTTINERIRRGIAPEHAVSMPPAIPGKKLCMEGL